MQRAILVGASTLAFVALGSSGCSSAPAVDLPGGWQTAKSVAHFFQASCGGSADVPDAPPEVIDVTATAGSIQVAYHHAEFRCDQAVEGFVRTGMNSVDFLVQPTDMNPYSVAGCDCLYEITMATDASTGPATVTVYRRWDHHGGTPTDPVLVGSASVTVP